MRFWRSSKLDEIGWCWMHIQAWIWWQGILLQSQFSLFLCILKPEAYAQKLDRSKTPAQLHIMNWHPDKNKVSRRSFLQTWPTRLTSWIFNFDWDTFLSFPPQRWGLTPGRKAAQTVSKGCCSTMRSRAPTPLHTNTVQKTSARRVPTYFLGNLIRLGVFFTLGAEHFLSGQCRSCHSPLASS